MKDSYLEIYLSQRSFDEGPGGDSPYAGNQIEKMVGSCTLEPDEKRAAKATFSFEYFNLLTKVNSIKVVSSAGKRSLNEDERKRVIKLAFAKNAISYASIRKELNLGDGERFNISYSQSDKSIEEIEKKTKFTYLTAYHTFKKAYGSVFNEWSAEKKNHLAYALTAYKNDNKIKKYLTENGFDAVETDIALTLPSFSKWGNLSEKALNKIIPYLNRECCITTPVQRQDITLRLMIPISVCICPRMKKKRPSWVILQTRLYGAQFHRRSRW